MYSFKEYSVETFAEIKPIWVKLEKGVEMTVFQTYKWYETLTNYYKKEKVKNKFRVWKFIVMYDNDIPQLIAPIEYNKVGTVKAKGLYFIGSDFGAMDYCNFIFKTINKDLINGILMYITKKFNCNKVIFEKVQTNSKTCEYISKMYSVIGKEFECGKLFLPDSFDEYKKLLSKHSRQNIRTAINRQNKDDIELVHELVFDIDNDTKEKLLLIRESRLKEKQKRDWKDSTLKGKIFQRIHRVYTLLFSCKKNIMYENLCKTFCFLVKQNNEIAGFFWGEIDEANNTYYVTYAGVNQKFEWYSPVISHFYLYLEEMYKSGQPVIRSFDFTKGGEKYKKDIGCTKTYMRNLQFIVD